MLEARSSDLSFHVALGESLDTNCQLCLDSQAAASALSFEQPLILLRSATHREAPKASRALVVINCFYAGGAAFFVYFIKAVKQGNDGVGMDERVCIHSCKLITLPKILSHPI